MFKGYAFMEKQLVVDFVTLAAYATPQIIQVKKDKFELAPKIMEKTKNKIRALVTID